MFIPNLSLKNLTARLGPASLGEGRDRKAGDETILFGRPARVKGGWIAIALMLLALGVAQTAFGDPTTLTISGATATVTGKAATTLAFPMRRTGDLSFDSFVQFETRNETAVAGTQLHRSQRVTANSGAHRQRDYPSGDSGEHNLSGCKYLSDAAARRRVRHLQPQFRSAATLHYRRSAGGGGGGGRQRRWPARSDRRELLRQHRIGAPEFDAFGRQHAAVRAPAKLCRRQRPVRDGCGGR